MFLIEEKVVELQMHSDHHIMADQNLPMSDEKNSTVFRHTCSAMPLRTLKVKALCATMTIVYFYDL